MEHGPLNNMKSRTFVNITDDLLESIVLYIAGLALFPMQIACKILLLLVAIYKLLLSTQSTCISTNVAVLILLKKLNILI